MADRVHLNRRGCLTALAAAVTGMAAAPMALAAPAGLVKWPELDWLGAERVPRSDLQGMPVVVVFWATYCAFCKRHNAHIDKLYRATDPRRLRILGVAVDSDAEAVRRYMATNGYRFPVALDAGMLRSQLTERRVIPMTCLVDRNGRPGLCIPGEMAEADVLALAKLALPEAR